MGPQHDTVAWEPANIPSLPLHLGGTGLHFPAPLGFGWHHISCQRNVGGSDTCHFRLIWLNMRCISLHILPLPAHWVTPGWSFCSTRSTRWQSHKMEATWVPATLLGRELPDSGGMGCEIWGSALSIMALKEEHWQRTGLRAAFSLVWLWGVRAIALLRRGESEGPVVTRAVVKNSQSVAIPVRSQEVTQWAKGTGIQYAKEKLFYEKKKLSVFGWEWWAVFHFYFGFDLAFVKPETTPNKTSFLSQLLCILMAKMPRKIVLNPRSCWHTHFSGVLNLQAGI